MRKTLERRVVRIDDYVAELPEREASLLPPGFEDNAEILRQAKFFPESTRIETTVIWEEVV